MDDKGLGLVAIVLIVIGGLLALVVVVAAGYYVTDGPVAATVTDKNCGSIAAATGSVDIVTRFPLPGIPHTVEGMARDKCLLAQDGNFVQYRLRSERVSMWASEGGQCIWDTKFGPNGCHF